jgi:hypothetical protein
MIYRAALNTSIYFQRNSQKWATFISQIAKLIQLFLKIICSFTVTVQTQSVIKQKNLGSNFIYKETGRTHSALAFNLNITSIFELENSATNDVNLYGNHIFGELTYKFLKESCLNIYSTG